MSKYKTILLISYIELVVWWAIIVLLGERLSLGNSLFNLALALFGICFGVYMIWRAHKVNITYVYRPSVIAYNFGSSLFGLANMLWFYYDVMFAQSTPYPSLADVFFLSHLPICIWGIFYLMYLFDPLIGSRFKWRLWASSLIFTFATVIIAGLLYTLTFGFREFSLERYLVLYFPFESFSVLILLFILYLKKLTRLKELKTSAFSYILLGHLFLCFADLFFLYDYTQASLMNGGVPDLLYATHLFLVYFGWSDFFEKTWELATRHVVNGIYFQEIKYYNPISLN